MVNTIDLGVLGSAQARLHTLLAASYPLPINAARFPLSPGQFYGQVATNCRLSDSKATSNKALMTRSQHVARSDISELAVVLPNWFWDVSSSKFELPNGGGIQYTASIEYPAGTYVQLRFRGQVRGFCPDFEQMISDFVSITIPAGQSFWINIWCQNLAGSILFQNVAQNAAFGEKMNVGASSTGDQTLSDHSGSAQAIGLWPLAIIGRTMAKSALIVGDSLQCGVGDANDSTANAVGILPRCLWPTTPYISFGSSGDSLHLFLQTYAKRLLSLPYVRNIFATHGCNDVRAGRSDTQIRSDLVSYWAILKRSAVAPVRLFAATLTHTTTSTDNWATTANQTKAQYFDTGVRETVNDWLRDGAPMVAGTPAPTGTAGATRIGNSEHPVHGLVEIADLFETSRNSGIWKVDGTEAKWTVDGVHPSPFGYQQAVLSGLVDNHVLA
jgi:lysophospholipase L1-like esterase